MPSLPAPTTLLSRPQLLAEINEELVRGEIRLGERLRELEQRVAAGQDTTALRALVKLIETRLDRLYERREACLHSSAPTAEF
jgi:hypothetical protein